MAGRYNFVSPGAQAANAIQELLMQRMLQERQARLDALSELQQADATRQRQQDRKSTRLNSSHVSESRMPSSA